MFDDLDSKSSPTSDPIGSRAPPSPLGTCSAIFRDLQKALIFLDNFIIFCLRHWVDPF
jgi:hypothetical protein